MDRELKVPDITAEFQEFSGANSWYKNIAGVQKFYIVPALTGFRICSEQCVLFLKLDSKTQELIKKYPIHVTPMIHSGNETHINVTLANWGWAMFKYMKQVGMADEANKLMLDTRQTRDIVKYEGRTKRTENPVLESVYSKEYKRMLEEAIKVSKIIWGALH